MRAGQLRHELALQSKQRVPDGAGGGSDQWAAIRNIRAEILTPTGRTAPVAQQMTALITAEIRVRFAPDIGAGLRLAGPATTYLIEAALPDNERSMLRLLCSNVLNP